MDFIDDVAGCSDDCEGTDLCSRDDIYESDFIDDSSCDVDDVNTPPVHDADVTTPSAPKKRRVMHFEPTPSCAPSASGGGFVGDGVDETAFDAPTSAPVVEEIAAGDDAGVYTKSGKFNMRHTSSFLTYAKSGTLQKDKLVSFFRTFNTKRFGVFEEKHADGDPHFHVVVEWSKQTNFKSERALDCGGVHPNIRKAHKNSWKYCVEPVKDKEVDDCPHLENITREEILKGNKWGFLLDIDDYGEFIRQCEKLIPQHFLLNRDRIVKNWKAHWKEKRGSVPAEIHFGPFPESYYMLADNGLTQIGTVVDGVVKPWMPETHSALLWGEAGLGKTTFAIYYMRHLTKKEPFVVQGTLQKLTHWNGTDPLIFDDMFFAGADDNATLSNTLTTVAQATCVRVLYGSVDIPARTPRMFLSNMEYPFKNPGSSVYGRRVQTFHVRQ
jgi:hypothetical protein